MQQYAKFVQVSEMILKMSILWHLVETLNSCKLHNLTKIQSVKAVFRSKISLPIRLFNVKNKRRSSPHIQPKQQTSAIHRKGFSFKVTINKMKPAKLRSATAFSPLMEMSVE